MKNQCIYCKKEGKSKEYAFPRSLLHKCAPLGAPEWIIEHLCEDCNQNLGELDDVLATRSSIAFIWKRIKDEWESEREPEEVWNEDKPPYQWEKMPQQQPIYSLGGYGSVMEYTLNTWRVDHLDALIFEGYV